MIELSNHIMNQLVRQLLRPGQQSKIKKRKPVNNMRSSIPKSNMTQRTTIILKITDNSTCYFRIPSIIRCSIGWYLKNLNRIPEI
jgi:hypothetical protein